MDFVHPRDKEKVKDFHLSLPDSEFAELEYRIVSNNKTIKWVLDEGRVVYAEKGRVRRIDHVVRDITEEKRVLDALKQSEEKYRSFFESTNDMAYTVTPEATFMDINEPASSFSVSKAGRRLFAPTSSKPMSIPLKEKSFSPS